MRVEKTFFAFAVFFLLIFLVQPLHAATITGTVHGPNGPVANAKVIANQCVNNPIEHSADSSGNYSIEFDEDFLNCLHAEPPQAQGNLGGEVLQFVDVSSDREIHLFLVEEVEISGTIELPEDFEGEPSVGILRLDKLEITTSGQEWDVENDSFHGKIAKGVHTIRVFGCKDNQFCSPLEYFSYLAVDTTNGPLSNLVVPLAEPRKNLIPTTPPIAALIQADPPDEGGIALVNGAPGAIPGPAKLTLVNLNTGQKTHGASFEDGSFSIPFLAPPGTWLEIRQDPTGLARNGTFAPGTIIRAPPVGDPETTMTSSNNRSIFGLDNEDRRVENFGVRDTGQVWITGQITDRNWSPGQHIDLQGEVKFYTNNALEYDPAEITLNEAGWAVLERIFDENGKQEIANPMFMSHMLTPTGLPIEREGDNGRRGSSAGIVFKDFSSTSFSRTSNRSFEANWQIQFDVPEDLPDGIYSLVLEPHIENIDFETLHFNNAYSQITESPFTDAHTTLITIGSPAPAKLSWVLGLNDFSNATRGTIAIEDRDRIGMAVRQTTNSHKFILPMTDAEHGNAIDYRLEPFAPLISASTRGWMATPTVFFKFPSGNLNVRVKNPDGQLTDLGSAPFRQPFVQEPADISPFSGPDPGFHAKQFFGLTTLDPKFDHTFTQYGRHEIEMTGSIDDVLGNTYQGGGTYEVWIARRLDMEFGVFPSTPFEVGDAFGPTVIVQPGVAAEVEILITHYPMSDTDPKIEHLISGTANRFGYFVPAAEESFVFSEPGEYRVDVSSSYWDDEGVLWMGSESWASVVETPDSPLITHGLRNRDGEGGRQQWFLNSNTFIEGQHLPFPYHNGDIIWNVDSDVDPNGVAVFAGISIQDTQGDFTEILRERNAIRYNYFPDFELTASTGEMELFSSTPSHLPAVFKPDAPDTHWGYFYSGAARPGIRVRDMVSEAHNESAYWRFEGRYSDQSGVGFKGDETNDFKFQFGGAVYRAPDLDFYYYGAHGSLWVGLPDGDPSGTRLMPPFQGNGGGPSGGPIMTLQGREIDMFLHPMGVRPGSILEVGDVAAFSGQIAPTLETRVWMRITSPSGVLYTVAGNSNKVGYFYNPTDNFVVDEPGVWSVKVVTTFDGITSAGQVTEPFPSGDILGSSDGTYHFYVVEPGSQPLGVDIPANSWTDPGLGAINIPLLPTDELTDVTVHRTTVMPGFLMEEADTSNTTYIYDAPTLHEDFPNLELFDDEARTGVDTVTMSFLVTGVDGGGNTVHRARQVLLQGEELMAPAQDSTFSINAGLNDAWVHAGAPNQGMFVTVFPIFKLIFAAWFTFDSVDSPTQAFSLMRAPEEGGKNSPEDAVVGASDQRWVTALGSYNGTSATLKAEMTTGGRFNSNEGDPQQDTSYGTISMNFTDCNSADVEYDFPGPQENGSFTMNRVLPDNIKICEGIVSGDIVPETETTAEKAQRFATMVKGQEYRTESAAFTINSGLNDSWVNPLAGFQGMFLTVFPDFGLIFAAWFTFDSESPGDEETANFGAADHRWLTALGTYSGTTANLKIENTTGGAFNSNALTPVQDTEYGTATIEFSDCNNATVTFNIPSAEESGEFNITRVLNDNLGLCTVLSD